MHLSKNESVLKREIIGIFDLDNATIQIDTRNFLKQLQKENKTVSLCSDLPKSFVLCDNEYTETVYITQLSSKTLQKRKDAI
ncbi:MAG: DUF370 domain-containing protein [Clostridia bacterium]